MLFNEWNLEDALVVEREEGREEGIGLVARNLLAQGLSPELIQKATGLDVETLQSLGSQSA